MLLRVSAWLGHLKQEMTGQRLLKITGKISAIKVKEIDADGKESYVIKEYRFFKRTEEDPTLED
jgi:hypothetical protein